MDQFVEPHKFRVLVCLFWSFIHLPTIYYYFLYAEDYGYNSWRYVLET